MASLEALRASSASPRRRRPHRTPTPRAATRGPRALPRAPGVRGRRRSRPGLVPGRLPPRRVPRARARARPRGGVPRPSRRRPRRPARPRPPRPAVLAPRPARRAIRRRPARRRRRRRRARGQVRNLRRPPLRPPLLRAARRARRDASTVVGGCVPAAAFAFRDEILGELASVFKKLASAAATCPWRSIRDAGAHRVAVTLLPTRDASLLASALVILRAREHVEDCRRAILEGDGGTASSSPSASTARRSATSPRTSSARRVASRTGAETSRRGDSAARARRHLRRAASGARGEGRVFFPGPGGFSSRDAARDDARRARRKARRTVALHSTGARGRAASPPGRRPRRSRRRGGARATRGAIAALVATLREKTACRGARLVCADFGGGGVLGVLGADEALRRRAGAAGILRQGGVYALGTPPRDHARAAASLGRATGPSRRPILRRRLAADARV